jgi:hypothetical protein
LETRYFNTAHSSKEMAKEHLSPKIFLMQGPEWANISFLRQSYPKSMARGPDRTALILGGCLYGKHWNPDIPRLSILPRKESQVS